MRNTLTCLALVTLCGGCPGTIEGGPDDDGGPPDARPAGQADAVPGAPDAAPGAPDAPPATADAGPVIQPDDPGAASVRFTIDTTAEVRPISPYIYGTNFPDWGGRTRHLALGRAGGNRWTAYNWENNASNAGSDWSHQNDAHLGGGETAGEAVRGRTAAAHAAGASMLVTVPIVGYVAADKSPGGDVNQIPNYLSVRFRQSKARKGTAFAFPPSTGDAFVYQDEFVHWFESAFPQARTDASRTIFYALDNEPDLWPETHPRIHPGRPTYDELASRTVEYAAAIKDVAPQALVFGLVSYGWQGFVNLQGAPDAGGRDFLEFFLDRLRAAETTAGHRLVDVLDLHWYPEARGGGVRITGDEAGAEVVAARLQAPRSLWDPTYTETSWITQASTNGPIRLLPRVREKIEAHYPGTRLAFTEYTYGGGGHISGGLAEADVLGVFGREGVFAAALWPLGETSFLYGGFDLYRNYDGAGGRFGSQSVAASTSDAAGTSVYASTDPGASRVVVVAINKGSSERTAAVAITHTALLGTAAVYQLTSAGSSPVRRADVAITARNAFQITLPAMSATTLVLEP